MNRLYQLFLQHPARNSGLALMCVFMIWVVLNTAYWQTGQHQAPLFTTRAPDGGIALFQTFGTQPEQNARPALVAGRAIMSEVQSLLAAKGFYHDVVNGIDGPATRAAIADYERSLGLEPTGEPSPQLLSRLRLDEIIREDIPLPMRAPAENPAPVTRPEPNPAERIMTVQRTLNRYGYGPVTVDGILGEGTVEAIRRFQQNQGLTPNGRLDDTLVMHMISIGALDM